MFSRAVDCTEFNENRLHSRIFGLSPPTIFAAVSKKLCVSKMTINTIVFDVFCVFSICGCANNTRILDVFYVFSCALDACSRTFWQIAPVPHGISQKGPKTRARARILRFSVFLRLVKKCIFRAFWVIPVRPIFRKHRFLQCYLRARESRNPKNP